MLVIFVVGVTCAHRVFVMVVDEIGIEQQVGVVGSLGGVIVGSAEVR